MGQYFGPPTPSFNNPEPNPEYFQPRTYRIASIAISGVQASVTTTLDNDYVVGQLVRFHIPLGWGIRQLNEQQGQITIINSSQNFIVNINITKYDPFVTPSVPFSYQYPQVSAIGDNNITTDGLSISGAFINIS